MEYEDKECECGDMEMQHVDGCEQCCIPECGCKEFIEKDNGLDSPQK